MRLSSRLGWETGASQMSKSNAVRGHVVSALHSTNLSCVSSCGREVPAMRERAPTPRPPGFRTMTIVDDHGHLLPGTPKRMTAFSTGYEATAPKRWPVSPSTRLCHPNPSFAASHNIIDLQSRRAQFPPSLASPRWVTRASRQTTCLPTPSTCATTPTRCVQDALVCCSAPRG